MLKLTMYDTFRVGTHPSGPALLPDGTTLKSWVEAHPESLGAVVLKRFGTDLPFLFKVIKGSCCIDGMKTACSHCIGNMYAPCMLLERHWSGLRPQAVACPRSSCGYSGDELALCSDALASIRVVFNAPCCLLQVLSVQTALSIQSHPDKKLAERLHTENPAVSDSAAASACSLVDHAGCVGPRHV
jgi:hypothetical protein